jgi:hypothetical protein
MARLWTLAGLMVALFYLVVLPTSSAHIHGRDAGASTRIHLDKVFSILTPPPPNHNLHHLRHRLLLQRFFLGYIQHFRSHPGDILYIARR